MTDSKSPQLNKEICDLISAIRDKDNPISLTREALSRIGKPSAKAIQEIIVLANSNNETVDAGIKAIHTLGTIAEPASQIIPALIKHVETGHLLQRIFALRALGKIETYADKSTPIIVRANPGVR